MGAKCGKGKNFQQMKNGMKNAIPAVINSDIVNKAGQAALSEVKQAINEEIQENLQKVEKEAVNFVNSLGLGEGNNNESPEKGTEREETEKKGGLPEQNQENNSFQHENNEIHNEEQINQDNQLGLQEENPEEKVLDLEAEEQENERKRLEAERERELEEERLREEEEDRERLRQEELERENQNNYYDNYNYEDYNNYNDYNDYDQENENESEEKPVEQNIQIKNPDDFFQVNQENDVMKMINGDDDEETGIKPGDFFDHNANANDLNEESEEQEKKDVLFLYFMFFLSVFF